MPGRRGKLEQGSTESLYETLDNENLRLGGRACAVNAMAMPGIDYQAAFVT